MSVCVVSWSEGMTVGGWRRVLVWLSSEPHHDHDAKILPTLCSRKVKASITSPFGCTWTQHVRWRPVLSERGLSYHNALRAWSFLLRACHGLLFGGWEVVVRLWVRALTFFDQIAKQFLPCQCTDKPADLTLCNFPFFVPYGTLSAPGKVRSSVEFIA